MDDRRFRIAFSFAGEKRSFVKDVAAILAKRFGEDKILYDKYHKAEFSRSDLAFYLPTLYHDHADLIVAVICPDYETKEWTGLEWTAIHDLLSQRKDDEVLLCLTIDGDRASAQESVPWTRQVIIPWKLT